MSSHAREGKLTRSLGIPNTIARSALYREMAEGRERARPRRWRPRNEGPWPEDGHGPLVSVRNARRAGDARYRPAALTKAPSLHVAAPMTGPPGGIDLPPATRPNWTTSSSRWPRISSPLTCAPALGARPCFPRGGARPLHRLFSPVLDLCPAKCLMSLHWKGGRVV